MAADGDVHSDSEPRGGAAPAGRQALRHVRARPLRRLGLLVLLAGQEQRLGVDDQPDRPEGLRQG
eukprot:9987167-Alexandrium_andersonii.AAC.1